MTEPRRLKRAVIKEEFVALTGDLVSAIFLNQLLYWTERVKDVDAYIVEEKARGKGADIDLMHGWIYKKAEELISETMVTISPSTARRRLEDLEDLGVIECRTNPNNGWDKILQYRVKLVELSTALYAKGFALEGYSLPEFHGGTPVKHSDARNRQIDAPRNHGDAPRNHGDAPRNHGDAAIPENTTKNTSENTSKGENTRLQDLPSPAEQQTPPQTALPINVDEPTYAQQEQQQQAKPYDFQSGLPQPKRVQEKRTIDVKVQEAKNLEISPADFRKMVDILLDASQKLAFINAQQKDSEDPDVAKELSDHRDAILFAAGLTEKYRTPEAIKAIIDDWKNENPRFKQIYPKQFKIHAANLLSKSMPSQSTSEAAKKEDTAFWSGELVDIGLKYPYVERKIKLGTGCSSTKDGHWIEPVYEDEEPAVEPQKAA